MTSDASVAYVSLMLTLSSLRKKYKKIKKIWGEDLISTTEYLETLSEECLNFGTFPVKSSYKYLQDN